MAVTIKDVAKLSNVNPSTVSRVIADSPRISEKTKKKVKAAMEELGYHPNFNARSLVNRNTQAIGIIMPSSAENAFQNPFFAEVLRGISSMAHEKKYSLYMSTGGTPEEIFEAVKSMVQGRRVDGIILLYSRTEDRISEYLKQIDFPFVVIGRPYDNETKIFHIDNDNFLAAKEVTTHLIKNGYKRIAFIGGSLDLVVTIDRLQGYKEALKEAEIPVLDDYIVHVEFQKEGGKEAVVELMSLSKPPTALVVTDDVITFGVLSTFDEMNIKVPDDISVISFNNVMLSEFSSPPLSSVDINIFQLGYNAVKCLVDLGIEAREEAKRIIIPHKLIIRDSCKALNVK